MKKHSKIFLTIIVSIFSFCFVNKVDALNVEYYGITINDNIINNIWSQLEGKTQSQFPNSSSSDNVHIYYRSDYSMLSISKKRNNNNLIYFDFFHSMGEVETTTSTSNMNSDAFPYGAYYINDWWNPESNGAGLYSEFTVIYDVYSNTIVGYSFPTMYRISGKIWWTYNSSSKYQFEPSITSFDISASNKSLTKAFDYDSNPQPNVFNFHLNGGIARHNVDIFNLLFDGTRDFSVELYPNEVEDFITNLQVEKQDMLFDGWYYDIGFTQPFTLNDSITTDVDLYAKFRYKKVDDFLRNINFNQYIFDSSQDYAIITRNGNNDVFLGLPTSRYDIEVFEYQQNFNSYKDNTSVCLVPIYNYNNIYYYNLNTMFTNNQEVMILPRSVFDDIENTDYKFVLTDNAYISYTSDLSNVTIVDKEGNIVNTNLENAYENSHVFTSENQSQEVEFKKMKLFLNELKSVNNVWNECFTYFYNNLPGIVRSLLIFIFNIIMILICLKLVGWK